MDIEQEVREFDSSLPGELAASKLSVKRILFKNTRRGSIDLLVDSWVTGVSLVVKCCHIDAPKRTLSEFENEVRFYNAHGQSDAVPDLLWANDRLLAIEYFQSLTLRDWLLVYLDRLEQDEVKPELRIVMERLFEGLVSLYASNISFRDMNADIRNDGLDIVSALIDVYNIVHRSGPMGVTRGYIETRVSRFLGSLATGKVNNYLNHIVQRQQGHITRGLNHGDLHLNNILVSEDLMVKTVDFARGSENGFPIVDLLYLTTVTGAMFNQHPNHMEFFVESLIDKVLSQWNSSVELFRSALPVLELAISLNSRFHYRSSKAATLRSQAIFLPSMLKVTGFGSPYQSGG